MFLLLAFFKVSKITYPAISTLFAAQAKRELLKFKHEKLLKIKKIYCFF